MSEIHILPNGLRVVHMRVPGNNVGHFGFAIKAGSGDETDPREHGLAHFVEHTLFKGTLKRSSWHILNRMEAVGGELNAFTTKADTVVYTAFPKGSLVRAVDLLVDLVLNSQFPSFELEKERQVIRDEINSYLDSAADAVYDDFEDLLYRDTPLGHNILGTHETVANISRDMCLGWLKRHYTAANMVAFYAGNLSLESFIRKAEPLLMLVPPTASPSARTVFAPPSSPFAESRSISVHQSHTVLGTALSELDMQERIALALTVNIIGGPGMNSLLNLEVRERRGLVYSIESAVSSWPGSTMVTTYFGCDPEDTPKCMRLVREQFERVADGYINSRRLMAAKKQYRGQMLLARENIENRIMGIARAVLHHGRALTLAESEAMLSAVSNADVAAFADALKNFSSLTLRP